MAVLVFKAEAAYARAATGVSTVAQGRTSSPYHRSPHDGGYIVCIAVVADFTVRVTINVYRWDPDELTPTRKYVEVPRATIIVSHKRYLYVFAIQGHMLIVCQDKS